MTIAINLATYRSLIEHDVQGCKENALVRPYWLLVVLVECSWLRSKKSVAVGG